MKQSSTGEDDEAGREKKWEAGSGVMVTGVCDSSIQTVLEMTKMTPGGRLFWTLSPM